MARQIAGENSRRRKLAQGTPEQSATEDASPSPGGPRSAKRSSLLGKLTGGGLGKPLGWGEGEPYLKSPVHGEGKQIVEAGAHDGQLAADILGWLKTKRSDVFNTIQYWILEPSPQRKREQVEKLASFGPKVSWFDSWDALPPTGVHGIIFSNELLDAMPVRRIGWDAAQKKWFEWGVASRGDEFVWTKLSIDNDLAEVIRSWDLPFWLQEVLPDGFSTEIGNAAKEWWRHAARALKNGKLLALDYGLEQEEFFVPQRKDGTLRAYYRHHLETDLLARPGEQDLTAQVNFTAIRRAGEAAGLKTESFITQAKFLTEIVQRMCERNPSSSEWIAKHSRSFQTLTHPEHLGRPFRVLVQERI